MLKQLSDPLAPWRSGSCEPWTVEILCALVSATKPQYLLETGTFEARTTLQLHYAAPAGNILITIENDLQRCQGGVLACAGYPNIRHHNDDALNFLSTYTGPPFDFVFLDDDHNAEHVAHEIDLLYDPTRAVQLVSPGAFICVHDVFGPFGLGAVVVARKGFLLDLPKLHAAGGLGILQVPS